MCTIELQEDMSYADAVSSTPYDSAIGGWSPCLVGVESPTALVPREIRQFAADTLLKRTETWIGGKAIMVDRKPHHPRTEFRHCLNRHTIALHVEGANSHAAWRHDGRREIVTGSTIGQIMVIPSGHLLEGSSDFPSMIRHIVLLFDPKMLCADGGEEASIDNLDLPYEQNLTDSVIATQMRALQNELNNRGLMGRLYAESLCCAIAVRIARIYSKTGTSPARGGLAPRRLRKIQDYIEANLADEITLTDLASIAGLSSAHFCRAFRTSAGMPTHQYIVQRRIDRAKTLLTEHKMSIAEIALAVGFGDQSHLTTHFRRLVGTTPGRFRNQT